jgi:Domain of unknown function (DUF4390)
MSLLNRRHLLLRTAAALVAGSVQQSAWPQRAPTIELVQLLASKTEDGLMLNYQVRFELPREIEDALMKGIAIVFVGRAELFSDRWYWTEKSRGLIERRWRLAFHPLSRHWRVSFDGLSQNYGSLSEALAVIQRNRRWRLLDNAALQNNELNHLEFTFELDRNELPRPLQIGLSDQDQWNLSVSRRINLPK